MALPARPANKARRTGKDLSEYRSPRMIDAALVLSLAARHWTDAVIIAVLLAMSWCAVSRKTRRRTRSPRASNGWPPIPRTCDTCTHPATERRVMNDLAREADVGTVRMSRSVSEAVWRMAGWSRANPLGLFCVAITDGAGAGLGAVAFRYLIFGSPGWPPDTSSSAGGGGRGATRHPLSVDAASDATPQLFGNLRNRQPVADHR